MKKPTPQEIKKAREVLASAGYFVENLWTDFDIIHRAKENGIKVSKKQAKEIMGIMGRRHDANNGVNWDFIDACVEEYFNN